MRKGADFAAANLPLRPRKTTMTDYDALFTRRSDKDLHSDSVIAYISNFTFAS